MSGPQPFFVDENNFGLLTDLYELTMAAAYWSNGVNPDSTFELYFRRLPPHRGFILSAGLEQALHYITHLKFSKNQVDWLRSHPSFQKLDSGFFDYLTGFRFSGD